MAVRRDNHYTKKAGVSTIFKTDTFIFCVFFILSYSNIPLNAARIPPKSHARTPGVLIRQFENRFSKENIRGCAVALFFKNFSVGLVFFRSKVKRLEWYNIWRFFLTQHELFINMEIR